MGSKKYRNKLKIKKGHKPNLKKKPISLWFFLVSLAVAIILFIIPKTPFFIIICLIIIFFLLLHPIFNFWWIERASWRKISSILILVCILIIIGYRIWPLKQEPIVGIKFLYPRNVRHNLREHSILIQNHNPQSAIITDFRMKIIFENNIVDVRPVPLLPSGGPTVHLGDVRITEKDGVGIIWGMVPLDTTTTKSFSITIQKYKINNTITNTNILALDCVRWPEKLAYSIDILIDLAIKPFYNYDKPLPYYEGEYFYEINGTKFSQKINGSIATK